MTDRPILFSSAMIRAILEGRKFQTRRVLKPVPNCLNGGKPLNDGRGSYSIEGGWKRFPCSAGDRLWVREAFSYETLDVDRNGFMPPWYWADGNPDSGDFTKPKPSIYMPRWASRITLTVTEVRVQRINEISEQDAFAEGVETDLWDMAPVAKRYDVDEAWFVGWSIGINEPNLSVDADEVCRRSYATLWDSIHGKGAWARNPFVCAISFSVALCNIDHARRS